MHIIKITKRIESLKAESSKENKGFLSECFPFIGIRTQANPNKHVLCEICKVFSLKLLQCASEFNLLIIFQWKQHEFR